MQASKIYWKFSNRIMKWCLWKFLKHNSFWKKLINLFELRFHLCIYMYIGQLNISHPFPLCNPELSSHTHCHPGTNNNFGYSGEYLHCNSILMLKTYSTLLLRYNNREFSDKYLITIQIQVSFSGYSPFYFDNLYLVWSRQHLPVIMP